jgi:hypothetical protein
VTLPADTMAIVVGVEEYQTGTRWRLDGPALDACRFARWLTVRGVPADRITLLVSPLPENADEVAVEKEARGYRYGVADHATVRDVFTQYLPKQRSGLLVLYWGGHGVIQQEERRLIYADATTLDKRNLNLSSLLLSMRSSTFAGHPQQLGLIDVCLNLVEELGWEGTMPNEEFSVGRTESRRDQRVLLAASPGERAVNVDSLKTGLFSQVVREALDSLPAGTWPPDADGLRDLVHERFEQLRNEGGTRQVPSNVWYRSRSDDVLVFATGSQAGQLEDARLRAEFAAAVEVEHPTWVLEHSDAHSGPVPDWHVVRLELTLNNASAHAAHDVALAIPGVGEQRLRTLPAYERVGIRFSQLERRRVSAADGTLPATIDGVILDWRDQYSLVVPQNRPTLRLEVSDRTPTQRSQLLAEARQSEEKWEQQAAAIQAAEALVAKVGENPAGLANAMRSTAVRGDIWPYLRERLPTDRALIKQAFLLRNTLEDIYVREDASDEEALARLRQEVSSSLGLLEATRILKLGRIRNLRKRLSTRRNDRDHPAVPGA